MVSWASFVPCGFLPFNAAVCARPMCLAFGQKLEAEVGAGTGANRRSLPPLALKTGTPSLAEILPRFLGSANDQAFLQSWNVRPLLFRANTGTLRLILPLLCDSNPLGLNTSDSSRIAG